MGKRLLDSSLFGSPSLAQCSPRAQDAFPRFILLADDFGCFHANPRVLLGRGWPLREDVTEEEIRAWMEEYIAAGMLRVWEEQGRVYAYLTGWDGEHGQKRRTEYHPDTNKHGSKRHAPVPPAADSPKCLKTLPARESGGKTPGSCREDGGKAEVPGGFPSTQSQFLSQAQPQDLAGASRAAPGQAPPGPEDHVPPAPTSEREDNQPSGSEQGELLDVPADPPQKRERKPPKPSRQQEIFRRMQEKREKVCEEDGVACHPEDENPRKINAVFARWKDTTPDSPEMDELNGAFMCFLNNERFREQRWPIWLFMSGTVYAQHVRLWQGEDAA